MKFKGTIVITDPCYIMNKNNKREMPKEYEARRPNPKDFFSFDPAVPEKYPDARPKYPYEITDFDKSLIEMRNRHIKTFENRNIKPYIPMYSETYEKECEDLMEAEYNWKFPYMSDWERCGCGHEMDVLGFKNYLTSSTYYGDWGCTTYDKDTNNPIGEFCADSAMVGVFLLEEILKYNPDFDLHLSKNHIATVIENFDGNIMFEKIHRDVEYNGKKYKDIELHVVGRGNINFITRQTSL